MKLLIMQSSPAPTTSSILGPNILLRTLISNTCNLCSQFLWFQKQHSILKTNCKCARSFYEHFSVLESKSSSSERPVRRMGFHINHSIQV